jgi:transcriptional regulator with XRE-family HTH domain
MKTEISLVDLVSRNIREHRKRNKISQEKLAEISGLHRTYIGAIERSERNITLNTLQLIANALNIEAKNLLEP